MKVDVWDYCVEETKDGTWNIQRCHKCDDNWFVVDDGFVSRSAAVEYIEQVLDKEGK
jgi:hypothetical protein